MGPGCYRADLHFADQDFLYGMRLISCETEERVRVRMPEGELLLRPCRGGERQAFWKTCLKELLERINQKIVLIKSLIKSRRGSVDKSGQILYN